MDSDQDEILIHGGIPVSRAGPPGYRARRRRGSRQIQPHVGPVPRAVLVSPQPLVPLLPAVSDESSDGEPEEPELPVQERELIPAVPVLPGERGLLAESDLHQNVPILPPVQPIAAIATKAHEQEASSNVDRVGTVESEITHSRRHPTLLIELAPWNLKFTLQISCRMSVDRVGTVDFRMCVDRVGTVESKVHAASKLLDASEYLQLDASEATESLNASVGHPYGGQSNYYI